MKLVLKPILGHSKERVEKKTGLPLKTHRHATEKLPVTFHTTRGADSKTNFCIDMINEK